MATYTSNYNLHQWEGSDDFLREDFNEDFSKIDTAIKGVETEAATALVSAVSATNTSLATKCEVVFGTYTGNGSASRTISLGFTPSAVLVECVNGSRGSSSGAYGGLALLDNPVIYGTYSTKALEVVSNGFWVSYVQYYSNLNVSGTTFFYMAFK